MNAEDIIKYLDDNLSNDEKQKFESQLERDQSLQKELASIKEMQIFAKSKSDEQKAIQSSREVYQQYKLKNKPTQKTPSSLKSNIKYLIPISVAALVLLGIFGLGLFDQAPLSNQELYAEYFSPADLSLTKRSESDQSLQKNAETAFNSGDYSSAIDILSQLIGTDNNNQELRLYRAISEMETDQLENAKKTFSSLANNSGYSAEAQYFLALCHLKENNDEAARSVLKLIPEDSYRFKEAEALLHSLQKK